jgi:hypothetical protein
MNYAKQNTIIHAAWRRWLRAQKKRQDPVGDFARDFLTDDCAKGLRTLSGIDRHMQDAHNAIDAALEARDRAWREWVKADPPELSRLDAP